MVPCIVQPLPFGLCQIEGTPNIASCYGFLVDHMGVEPISENVPLNFLRAHPDCLCIPRFAIRHLSWSVLVRNSDVQYSSLKGICFYYIYPLFLNRRRYRGNTIVRVNLVFQQGRWAVIRQLPS